MYSYSGRGTTIGVSPDENPSDPVYYACRSSCNGNENNTLRFDVVDANERHENKMNTLAEPRQNRRSPAMGKHRFYQ